MDIRPDYANLLDDGKEIKVNPEKVNMGDVIIIKPGEKIPIDGVVIEGNTSLNTFALTGETVPREVGKKDEVLSGSINNEGLIKVKTTKKFSDSTVSKILDLVENDGTITKRKRLFTQNKCK
jgi:Zn2+/Cd2+-exporting ATPase